MAHIGSNDNTDHSHENMRGEGCSRKSERFLPNMLHPPVVNVQSGIVSDRGLDQLYEYLQSKVSNDMRY